MQRLKEAAEKAKIELSGVTTSNINLPYITADATGPKHLDLTLTRAKFNELTAHLVEATVGPVRQAMSDAGLTGNDIAKVLMVGGSSRIPAVQDAVKKLTGKEGFKGINPDECVAMGAALQGGVLGGDVKGLLLLDVTPLSLGIETMGGVMHQAHRAQHHHPHQEEPDLLHRRRRPDLRWRSTSSRASVRWPRTTRPWAASSLDGIAPAPPRRSSDRGHLRHRRQRHRERLRQGPGHRQGAAHHHHLFHQHVQGGHRQGREGSRAVRR